MVELLNLYGFWPQILQGLGVTLQIALAAFTLGISLGLMGSMASRSPFRPLRWATKGYTTIVRGVPELLILLLFYFGSSQVLMAIASLWGYDDYIELSPFVAGFLALGFVHGAYSTEVFRAAFAAINKGQWEGAFSLGLSKFQAFFLVILPQIWRLALPPLGNLFLVLLKDTSLVSVIGVADLMRAAYIGAGSTREPFTFYMAATLIYLSMTFMISLLLRSLEKHHQIPGFGR